jgi:uncharacterized protein (TIGR02646 family)
LISVTRSSQPAVLQKNAASWLSKLKAPSSAPNTPKEQLKKAQNKYRHAQIKDALVNMFHGKCAYCESKITVVTYGAIEHFYPKSKYVDLTFEWSNLLLSCDVCNNANHKGTKFPLDAKGNPLLIDPTDENTDPNKHLEFDWDAIAGLASVYGRDERGETVETIFDLNGMNGRRELVAHRSQYVKKLFALLRLARSGDEGAIALLKESCDSSAEYSAFALVHIRPYLQANQ